MQKKAERFSGRIQREEEGEKEDKKSAGEWFPALFI